jgi:hypothetical protein
VTTRHSGYLVTLDEKLREDDAREVIRALEMIKGVADVRPVEAGTVLSEQNAIILRDSQWRRRLAGVAREMTEVPLDGS